MQFIANYRPPDVVGVGIRFCPCYSFLSSISISYLFLFRQLPSELTERNSNKLCHMFGSEPDLKMHVQKLGHPFPQKLGAIFDLFRLRCNLTVNLTANIVRTKHDIDNRATALKTTEVPYTAPTFREFWSAKAEKRTVIFTQPP